MIYLRLFCNEIVHSVAAWHARTRSLAVSATVMRCVLILFVVMLGIAWRVPAASLPAGVTAEDVQGERADMLVGLAREDPALLARVRQRCASGQEPAWIAKQRADYGSNQMPDAADYCATALRAVAQAGALLGFYHDLKRSLAADEAEADLLPEAIGTVIARPGAAVVPLGAGRGATITAALAFDAGFTNAYRRAEAWQAGLPDAYGLKPVAEQCLGSADADLRLCYATGYAYGVLAVNGREVTAVR